MKISQKIKKLRKEKKWKQAELSEKLGIHITHISRLETGRYTPSIDLLRKISEVFEVTADYLIKEDGENFQEEIQNQTLATKIRMIDKLDKEEQQALLKVIDGLLTKQKILNLLTQKEELVGM